MAHIGTQRVHRTGMLAFTAVGAMAFAITVTVKRAGRDTGSKTPPVTVL